MMSNITLFVKRIGIFDLCTRLLIILLPFTTLVTVFGKVRIGIPFIGFYKEILLSILVVTLAWNIRKGVLKIQWGYTDILIGIYVLNLIIITIFTTGIEGLIYGGRYDFAFLIAFWVLYHGSPLLKEGIGYYLRLFLFSTGAMIGLSALLKFPLSEDLLLYVGYSGNPSVWEFSGVPPIFHGIDGANVRRFQGILDGPNTMGAFLILFSGIFIYYYRSAKEWYFMNGCLLIGLFIMVIYTYSRSALIGVICATFIALFGSFRYIYRRYRREFISISALIFLLFGAITLQYSDRIGAIIAREGSTKGHSERMLAGIDRAVSHPLGQGLGSAGPGYRYVHNLEGIPRENVEERDRFYIPESWYIQQFIEGGIVGGVCFIILMLYYFILLYKKHIFLASTFAGICVMNLFLHTFEASPLSLLLFIIMGIILGLEKYGKRQFKQ